MGLLVNGYRDVLHWVPLTENVIYSIAELEVGNGGVDADMDITPQEFAISFQMKTLRRYSNGGHQGNPL